MQVARTLRVFLTYCMLAGFAFLLASVYFLVYIRPSGRVISNNRNQNHLFQKPPATNLTIFNVGDDSEHLGHVLENKLKTITVKRIRNYKPTCHTKAKIANSCNKKCLQTELPDNAIQRVKQLVTPSQLQMSSEEHAILQEMANKVEGNYEIILLTAASSNHFLESQALFKNLHEKVYPYLKNFTLIFYNLGLTPHERNLMMKYCKCQVTDFPFDKFPKFVSTLNCYSWKPVIIKAHLWKANFVFWMDASIRFHSSSKTFFTFLKAAQERGLQIGGSNADSPFRTLRSMYHFFGDEPCAYLGLGQARATLGVYHREYFVDRVILEPWVACALEEECICPSDRSREGCRDSKTVSRNYYQGKGGIVYGLCHRFDQSALSLIIHKLYQDSYRWVMVQADTLLAIRRRDTVRYFPQD
ncbi:hypothetical protein BsWGS_21263 [Bradybaena similaris]